MRAIPLAMIACVACVACVACGREAERATPTPTPTPTAIASDARVELVDRVLPATTRELITGVIDDWKSTTIALRLWTRARDGAAWHAIGAPWPAVIGRAGAAWGSGLHGVGAPAGRAGPIKREGDRTSPAGAFAVRAAYGYAAAPPTGSREPYTALAAGWQCVDDPASRHYGEILDRGTVTPDWASAETMRRDDELYTWVVDLAHNPTHTAGVGSCIFFHVWHAADAPTVGCTAMAQPALEQLLAALDPAAAPVYVLLPRADYDALAPAWGLPPR